MLLATEGKNMQSEANIRKVLDAAEQGEAGDDDEMNPMRDAFKWVLGIDTATADQFIKEFITDPYF